MQSFNHTSICNSDMVLGKHFPKRPCDPVDWLEVRHSVPVLGYRFTSLLGVLAQEKRQPIAENCKTTMAHIITDSRHLTVDGEQPPGHQPLVNKQ